MTKVISKIAKNLNFMSGTESKTRVHAYSYSVSSLIFVFYNLVFAEMLHQSFGERFFMNNIKYYR